MIENCKTEILDVHEFFDIWLNGNITPNNENLQRVYDSFADDFTLITPGGEIFDKESLANGLLKAHGSRKNELIRIKNVDGRMISDEICLMMYEEWQGSRENPRVRLSTALFRQNENTPNNAEWVNLNEVWIKKRR